MTKYLDSIDEIAEAVDRLKGDGYEAETRAAAITAATHVWFHHEQDRRLAEHQKRLEDAMAANAGARQQFFDSPTSNG